MMKKLVGSFLVAFQNIRSNFFHTLLSVLGIVIGVAALVIILSMIDGMEEFAQKQISTTSLKTVEVRTNPNRSINGINIPKDTFSIVTADLFKQMEREFGAKSKLYFVSSLSKEIQLSSDDSVRAAVVNGVSPAVLDRFYLSAGKRLDTTVVNRGEKVVLLNQATAFIYQKDSAKWGELLGDTLRYGSHKLLVIGIAKNRNQRPEVFVPFSLFSPADLRAGLPLVFLEAAIIEDVPKLKEDVSKWLSSRAHDPSDFSAVSNEFRVQQAAKAFLLFRIVMGLIVGVAVVVGGIGVMNVLLISVTERTREIGVRKAVGANRRDIVMQFLAESVTVSVFGSLMGLLFGVLMTMAIVPILKALTDAPFSAAYTWNTFFIVSVVAVLIGVVFGTYPALRASRLDPVEAIRHE